MSELVEGAAIDLRADAEAAREAGLPELAASIERTARRLAPGPDLEALAAAGLRKGGRP